MIDSLLSKYGGLAQTDPRFRSITSHFDSQRAGGAIYDSNMRKITVWNDYFSRQNLGKR